MGPGHAVRLIFVPMAGIDSASNSVMEEWMKVLAVVCSHKSAALYSYQYLIVSSVLMNVREKVIQNNG